MSTNKERIARILLDAHAVTLRPDEPFTFASGIKSPVYTDNRLLISLPKERKEIVNSYVALMQQRGWDPDVIAGVATAGIPWAAWIAEQMHKPMIFVRSQAKDHGTGVLIEGSITQGSKVVVIEDLFSSGSSTVGVIKTLRAAGVQVLGCLAIFTYGMQKTVKAFGEAGVSYDALTDFETLLAFAVKEKRISQREAAVAHAWHKNPDGWQL